MALRLVGDKLWFMTLVCVFYQTEVKIKCQQLRWSEEDTERVYTHFRQYVYYKLHESGTMGPHPSERVLCFHLFKFSDGHFS